MTPELVPFIKILAPVTGRLSSDESTLPDVFNPAKVLALAGAAAVGAMSLSLDDCRKAAGLISEIESLFCASAKICFAYPSERLQPGGLCG